MDESRPDPSFGGKLALQQRVLTVYRAAFFETLAQACEGGLNVCAGLPQPEESIAVTDQIRCANFQTIKNEHLFKGRLYLCYQRGLPDWLEACAPDALIVEANPRYLSTPAAIRWMRKRNRPVIGWGLGARPLSRLSPFLSKMGRENSGSVASFFCKSI